MDALMRICKFTHDEFESFVKRLIQMNQRVEAPQAKGERFAFGPLKRASDLRLDYDVTILPPKKYVLPQTEPLLTFEVRGAAQSVLADQEMVLFGVHPYDLVAINQMDELFEQGEYDTHYMCRRKKMTIVALDVVRPSANVFASSMGTATVKHGFDMLLTVLDDGSVIAEAATAKGERLLQSADKPADATEADLAQRRAVQERNEQTLNRYRLACKPSYLPKLLESAYDHPVWEERAQRCYSCGSCNLVCPTCYCFDVRDEVNWDLKTGTRSRCWDGCLLENFATVAGNHNFRKQRAERFRHRLYRKGKYVPAKIGGQIACVGCGRCITACTAKIANPIEIYNRLMEEAVLG